MFRGEFMKSIARIFLTLSSLALLGVPALAERYTLPLLETSTASDAATGVVRILNATDESGTVEIYAVDDAGTRSGPATFTLNASAAAEFSASDLVSGNATKGLTGGIGTVSGDARLEIDTELRIVPAAYVRAADGTLSAMHDTVLASAASDGGYEYLVPIFNPSTEMTQVSRLRLINVGDAPATVTITGRDDSGAAATGGEVSLTLAAGAARTLTAQQLEAGESTMDSTEQPAVADGICNVGLRLGPGERCTYPGTSDDFSVSDAGLGRFLFATAGGSINIRIENYDFVASHQGGGVWRIDRVEGRTEESDEGNTDAGGSGTGSSTLGGQLGAGTGKWRLTVSSDQPLEVVNIVASAAGYWNNLSTTAVAGAAPADEAGLNERFVGNSVIFETDSGGSTVAFADGTRFTDTVEADGVTESYMGDYSYRAIGPDAGRLTLDYDDGDACRANLYFSTRTSGWFASHCTGADHPADGTWLGGTWTVEAAEGDGDDGAGEVAETTYEVNDTLPGVPTSGLFVPAVTSGGSVSASGSGTTIALNNGGYIELNDGTRYTCASVGGCSIVNGTVTAGTVTGRAAGTGEVDRFPSFRTAINPGNQSYTVGTPIDTLALPEASGGNGDLTYSLSPTVPGLTFNVGTRQLSGTPSTAGTYSMTYTVADEDGDTDSLGFTIAVSADTPAEGSLGVCQVGMTLSSGQSCTYPDTTDEFSVNARGRGSFLTFLAGIRIRINNQTINGRVYDFEASHQGDGVWRIDRIAGSTEVPTNGGDTGTDTSPSFAAGSGPGNQTYTVGTAIDTLTLPVASGGDGTLSYSLAPSVPGLTFNASTRQLTGTPSTAASYNMTYTVTDEDGDTDTLSFTITVEESGDDDTSTGASYGVNDALPGVPTGSFLPAITSGGSVVISGGRTTITLRNGGYIQLNDGTRYTCTSADGCTIENGTVTQGIVVGGPDSGSDSLAPADTQAFNSRVVGNRLHGQGYYIDFPSAGRFLESDRNAGSYSYTSTGADTGTLSQTYDDTAQYGGSCTFQLTFDTETTGTLSFTCASGLQGQGSWTITSSDVPPAPRVVRDSATDTSFTFGFPESVDAGETKAFDFQLRRKTPQGSWQFACDTITNDSADAVSGVVTFTATRLQPGTIYEMRYRSRNSSSCDSGTPGSWSLIGEGRTTGAAQGLGFTESGPVSRSIPENVPGGINVGTPVSAAGGDALTYSIGGVDAGSFEIVAETGQIRTAEDVWYDYETKNRYEVDVTVADDAGNRESIDVTIDLRDLGPN